MAKEEQNENEMEQAGSLEAQQGEMDAESTEQGESSQQESSSGGRGFAGMSEEKRRQIAAKGGRSQGKDSNPANFANDREKAAAAGRVGGQNSRGGGNSSNTQENE